MDIPWFFCFEKRGDLVKKSLKLKIIFVFITMLIIFTFSSIWSIINFNNLSKSIDNIMESNYRSIEAAQNMIIAIERQDSAELEHMFSQQKVLAFNQNERYYRLSSRDTEVGTGNLDKHKLCGVYCSFNYLIHSNGRAKPMIIITI
jgi:hypothetical protein